MYNNTKLADSNGVAVTANFTTPTFGCHGGSVLLMGDGTFGGGSLNVLWYDPAGNPHPVLPQGAALPALTAAGTLSFRLPAGQFAVALTGATTPSINYSLVETNGP